MSGSNRLLTGMASLFAAILLSGRASAITVPDSGTCGTGTTTCFGITQNASGGSQPIAISGGATATNGIGIYGYNSATTGGAVGVYGLSINSSGGTGVFGVAGAGIGVAGRSTSSSGVYGVSTSGN